MDKYEHISDYLANPEKSFMKFEIDLSDKLKKSLKDINIENENTFNYYGYVDKLDSEKVNNFFVNIGQNDEERLIIIEKFIAKLTKKVCNEYNRDSVWLAIRVTLPDNEFDIPRWHIDGKFFENVNNEIQSKFIMTVKGPGTLFCDANKEVRKEFFENFKGNHEISQRQKLDEILKSQKIIQLKNDQGAIFLVGDINIAAIHSEPPFSEPRIFLSILPGHKYQIDDWENRKIIKKNLK